VGGVPEGGVPVGGVPDGGFPVGGEPEGGAPFVELIWLVGGMLSAVCWAFIRVATLRPKAASVASERSLDIIFGTHLYT
jgi:hypothetical protein